MTDLLRTCVSSPSFQDPTFQSDSCAPAVKALPQTKQGLYLHLSLQMMPFIALHKQSEYVHVLVATCWVQQRRLVSTLVVHTIVPLIWSIGPTIDHLMVLLCFQLDSTSPQRAFFALTTFNEYFFKTKWHLILRELKHSWY